jgi:undecaprenyl-diphosphatase
MGIFEAVVLAIVEGLTEFLPVSSTGHMVLASSAMGIADNDFVKMFTVAIQFGAILSVVVLYWKRFFQSIDFYFKLGLAFIPAAIFGFLLNDYIDAMLENALVVAITLLLGGLVLLFVDKWFAKTETSGARDVEYKNAFFIGLFQVIAMIPGVSRSAATIIGGLTQKLNRTTAAEFSFFLAVPTMLAATGYKMLKYHLKVGFNSSDISILLIGNVVAFVVAIIAIKAFIGFLTKYGFKLFGWYRIIVGAAILILYAMGYQLQII